MKVSNLENIELQITNVNASKIYFGDFETLRGKKIKHIDIPDVSNVTVSPLGRAVVNDTVYEKSFLVLSVCGKEQINRIPLKSLNPYANNGQRLDLNDLIVDWTKSFIEIGSTPGIVANEAFFLNIFF